MTVGVSYGVRLVINPSVGLYIQEVSAKQGKANTDLLSAGPWQIKAFIIVVTSILSLEKPG